MNVKYPLQTKNNSNTITLESKKKQANMSHLNSAEVSNLAQSDQLIPGLYKVVSGLNSAHRSSSQSDISSKELLLQLDPNDTNELTTNLKEKLTKSLSSLVERELEQHSQELISNTDPGKIVNSISESILENARYTELYGSLSSSLREATLAVIDEMELHSREGSLNNYLPVDTQTSESLSANFPYSCMPYISSAYLKELVDKFDISSRPDVRREALQAIIQFSPSEMLSCPDWPTLHVLVTRSLADQDDYISNNSFALLLRLFSTSNLTAIKEAYTILVEHLIDTFTHPPTYLQQIKYGIDVCKPEIGGVMQKFQLLSVFINSLPNYWFRFNNAYMTEVIDKTLDLLMLQIEHDTLTSFSKAQPISPIHFLGLVDHKANWFQTLLHAEYSRHFVVSKLEKHPKFLCTLVEYISLFVRQIERNDLNQIPSETQELPLDYYYNEDCLNYLFFIVSLKAMQNILIFECRHILFPHSSDGEYFKVKNDAGIHFISTLLDKLYSNNNSLQTELDPYQIVLETIMKALKRGRINDQLFSNGKIFRSLLQPLKEERITLFQEENSHLSYVYELMECLTQKEIGRKYFTHQENMTQTFKSLVTQTKLLLEDSPEKKLVTTIQKILTPVINILNMPECISFDEQFKVIQFLSNLLKKPNFSQNNSNRHEVLDITGDLLSTPKGIMSLNQYGILDECIEVLFTNCDINLNCCKTGSIRYGYYLSQLSNFPCAMSGLNVTNICEHLTDILVKLLNRINEPLLYQQTSLIAPLNRNIHRALHNIAKVLVNYPALTVMVDRTGSEGVSGTSITKLLTEYVIITPPQRINDVCNFEESHTICLSLLNLLLSSLDNFILLEDRFGLSKVMISLQNYMALQDGTQILDQPWYERNRVLLKVAVIGGPSEKMHPVNSLYSYEDIEKEKFPTFTNLPIPTAYLNFQQKENSMQENSKDFPTSHPDLESWFIKQLSSTENNKLLKDTQALLQHSLSRTDNLVFPKSNPTFDHKINANPTAGAKAATKLIVQYGLNLGLLKSGEPCERQLDLLLANCRSFLVSQQIKLPNQTMKSVQNSIQGYDWFVGIIFILLQGNPSKCFSLLVAFSSQLASCYVWLNRIYKSQLLPQLFTLTGCHWGMVNLLHYLELIVKTELPNTHAALHISGIALGTICSSWVRQCFLNFLDFEEICYYLLIVLILGVDYQLYFVASILKHLEMDIMKATQENNLMGFLLESPIRGYRASNGITYMRELEERWRNAVNTGLRTLPE